ncbi:MAG: HAD family hydrolase [Coriobacteriales bacterium]|nr:HAD family hydrolase [Coriobacteriales bacterium]
MADDIRLILSDIDGTILPYGSKVVSARTCAAFHAAQKAGIHVGPASGRGFSHIPASFGGDASCSATCLATNGMEVYLDGALLCRKLIPREATVRMAEFLRQEPGAGLLCFENGIPLMVEGTVDDLEQAFPIYASQCRHADAVPDHDLDKVNIFIAGDLDATRRLMERLAHEIGEVDYNLPVAGFINTTPPGWSKASGIDVLCEALGITIEQVVVFGDAGNDVEMLEHVPNSVAVAGASAEAAAAARWHIGRCEDEAVAAAIEDLAAGVWPFVDPMCER